MGYGPQDGKQINRKLLSGYTPPAASSTSAIIPNADAYFAGYGTLSGSFPDGVTRVEGAPSSATIRVLLRTDDLGDGILVAQVQSAADGTWEVAGLDAGKRFDVVCRHPDYNDMILSNVTPIA